MAANQNLILQLLITAKDEASSIFGKLFGYLDDNTKVISGKIREAFSGLFGGAKDSTDAVQEHDRLSAGCHHPSLSRALWCTWLASPPPWWRCELKEHPCD